MINFGPLAAQDDPDILSYFHVTHQIKELVSRNAGENKFIYVTRPGGGKTALVKWLENSNFNRKVIAITPNKVRFSAEDGDTHTSEDQRLLITAELFTGFILEVKKMDILSEELQNECKAYSTSTWLKGLGKIVSERFEGISILGNGFSLKADVRRAYLREIRKESIVDKASVILKKIVDESNVLVVVDDPEFIVGSGTEDVSSANAIRIGAFLSVLQKLNSLGVQVIIFVKEHIIQAVQENYRDFSHFEDRIEELIWTSYDLCEIINLRLKYRLGKSWNEVFSMDQKEFETLVIPHLINGPRDLLSVCNMAGDSTTPISRSSILRSLQGLKILKWKEIAVQYKEQWPSIDLVAKTIIKLLTEKFSDKKITKEQLKLTIEENFQNPDSDLFKLRKIGWINTALWDTPSLEERLFLIGCLGYIYDNNYFYSWAGRSLTNFRHASKVFISPLFTLQP